MIRAYCNLPGYDDVRFDATPWFERATPAAVGKLVQEEWGGLQAGMAARTVAEIDGYSRLGDILAYRRAHRTDLRGKSLLLEINIDPHDALAWLSAERPDVHAAIVAEHGEAAAAAERTKAYWEDPNDPDETNYLKRAGTAPSLR